MNKRVIIIGGGLAGLSAGIYAQLNGFDSTIYESNQKIGGKYSGFDNKQKFMNSFPRIIYGLSTQSDMAKLWSELINIKDNDIHNLDYLFHYQSEEVDFFFHKDLKKLKDELQKISSYDIDNIEEFIELIQLGMSYHMITTKSSDLIGVFEARKEQNKISIYKKLDKKIGSLDIKKYLSRFKSTKLQNILATIMVPETSCLILFSYLGKFAMNEINIIDDYNTNLVDQLKMKYLSMNGEIKTKSEVMELLFSKPNHIDSIKLSDNKTIKGDYFIATCDPQYVFEKLLKKKYRDRRYYLRYEDYKNYPVSSAIIATFSLNNVSLNDREYIAIPATRIAANMHNYLNFVKHIKEKNDNIYSCIINQKYDDYDFWKIIIDNKKLVQEIEMKIWTTIQKTLQNINPKVKINQLNIDNPITISKSYRGALYGFNITPLGKNIVHDGCISEINNLFLASHWQQSPGGIVDAIVSGKFAIQHICRQEKIKLR